MFPFVRNLHKMEPPTLTILIAMKPQEKGRELKHMQALESKEHSAHKSRNKHTHTTQRVHIPTSAQISNTTNYVLGMWLFGWGGGNINVIDVEAKDVSQIELLRTTFGKNGWR